MAQCLRPLYHSSMRHHALWRRFLFAGDWRDAARPGHALALFRWLEAAMPALSYAYLRIRFLRKEYISEVELLALIEHYGISSSNYSYPLVEDGKFFEYRMTIRSQRAGNFKRLADTLARMNTVLEFEITPAGEK